MFSTLFVNACILIRLYNFFPDSVHVYFVSIFCIIVKETLSWSLTFNSRFPCNHTHNNLSASRTRVIKVSCSILNNTHITHIVTFSFQISFNLPCISHFQTLLGQQAQRSSFPGSSSARKLLHMFSIFQYLSTFHLVFVWAVLHWCYHHCLWPALSVQAAAELSLYHFVVQVIEIFIEMS